MAGRKTINQPIKVGLRGKLIWGKSSTNIFIAHNHQTLHKRWQHWCVKYLLCYRQMCPPWTHHLVGATHAASMQLMCHQSSTWSLKCQVFTLLQTDVSSMNTPSCGSSSCRFHVTHVSPVINMEPEVSSIYFVTDRCVLHEHTILWE